MTTLPNFTGKTIWTGDNLDILRGMNSESVDLIYLVRGESMEPTLLDGCSILVDRSQSRRRRRAGRLNV